MYSAEPPTGNSKPRKTITTVSESLKAETDLRWVRFGRSRAYWVRETFCFTKRSRGKPDPDELPEGAVLAGFANLKPDVARHDGGVLRRVFLLPLPGRFFDPDTVSSVSVAPGVSEWITTTRILARRLRDRGRTRGSSSRSPRR